MTTAFRTVLEGLLPSGGVLSEAEARAWRTGNGGPEAVVAPATEEELAGVLSRAGEEGWTVLPAGRGSWLDGGGTGKVDLVVSTRRLNRIQEYEPADLTFTAGAGISLSALREATASHGQWLPLDPPGGGGGSLGATVATGSWGSLRPLYGTPRDQVLGVTMVSGDGRILRWGGRVVKNVAGFDVTRLCIGSWGTLGIITFVSARLFPLPQADVSLVLRAPTVGSLLRSARALARSSLPFASLELLDPMPWPGPGGGGSAGGLAGGGPPGPVPVQRVGWAGLVLRLMGSEAQVEEMQSRAGIEPGVADGLVFSRVAGEGNHRLHADLGLWESKAGLVVRMALLPSDLEVLFEEGAALRERWESGGPEGAPRVRMAAHIGAGVLRVAVDRLPTEGRGLDAWATELLGIRGRLEARGGSLRVSRGPAPLLEAVGPWGSPGAEGVLMRALKDRFDSKGILVPGRLGL